MLKHAAVNLRSIELTGFVSLKNTEGKKIKIELHNLHQSSFSGKLLSAAP